MLRPLAIVLLVLAATASGAVAQSLTQRGFADARTVVYPQDAPNDAQTLVMDFLLREEVIATATDWLQVAAGVDIRANTHDQVEPDWSVDVSDRTPRRPPLSIRRLTAAFHRGPVVIDAGKQFIRWGKTDIVTPTDRFAPRDYTYVFDSEFLAVTGARGMVATASDSVDVIWVPRFTPSRTPDPERRWSVLPDSSPVPLVLDEDATRFPDGSQVGVRWNRTGGGLEWSLSFFDGFSHLPLLEPQPSDPGASTAVFLVKRFPTLRMYGGDLALSTRWFTLKADAGYFTSSDPAIDDYGLYVVQLERQTGEWLILGGYAGEVVATRRPALALAADRGMTRSFLGRASYTIDPARSLAIEGAVHDTGGGWYVEAEFSEARGAHWRWTVTGMVIGGRDDDVLGQYDHNSHLAASLRYSF